MSNIPTTLKRYTGSVWDVIHPYTTIAQVDGLSTALTNKLSTGGGTLTGILELDHTYIEYTHVGYDVSNFSIMNRSKRGAILLETTNTEGTTSAALEIGCDGTVPRNTKVHTVMEMVGSSNFEIATGYLKYTINGNSVHLAPTTLTGTHYITFPNASGMIALTSQLGDSNVQSDWTQATDTEDDYIKNKPTLFGGAWSDLTGTQPDPVSHDNDQHSTNYFPIDGGTLSGVAIGVASTAYTSRQLRNVVLSTGDATGGSNGDIWIKYTA